MAILDLTNAVNKVKDNPQTLNTPQPQNHHGYNSITQTKQVNGSTLTPTEFTSGVPRGAVMAPLVFLCHI